MSQALAALTEADVARLFSGPPERVPDALRSAGLFPMTAELMPIPASAMNPPVPAAAPFAHFDPARPHVDGRGGLFANSPSGLFTEFVPPELIIWGAKHDFSYLIVYFLGLGANTQAMGTIDLKLFSSTPTTVRISATNNPSTMVLTTGSTGGKRVTVQVPMKATASGFATVLLQPDTSDQGFIWYGADVRKL
jgi:hypothetical protein